MPRCHHHAIIFLILISFGYLYSINRGNLAFSKTNDDSHTNFAIAMTSIPPRFDGLTPTLLSWLHQLHPPNFICIYIPSYYLRFRLKNNEKEKETSTVTMLYQKLIASNLPSIQQALNTNKIRIVSINKDWGPLTRLVGVLESIECAERNNDNNSPCQSCFRSNNEYINLNYWLFADDDVMYASQTLQKYQSFLETYRIIQQATDKSVSSIIPKELALTQFAESYRLAINFDANAERPSILIPHVQAVDTYIVNHQFFTSAQTQHGLLNAEIFHNIIDLIHQRCKSSFYQDDYLVSVLFYAAGIRVRSIWQNDKLVGHVDGVSKSNFQMHMHPKVFEREFDTKSCLIEIVPKLNLLSEELHGIEDL
jgi:hypothetical protein